MLDVESMERLLLDSIDRTPDATVIDEPTWVQLETLSSPFPHHNQVIRCRLDPNETDRRIAEIRDDHVARRAGLRWVAGPWCSPDDLSARLERAGVPLLAPSSGMARQVPSEAPALSPRVRVVRATAEDAETVGEITTRAWDRPPAYRQELVRYYRQSLDRLGSHYSVWLAYLDDELVGTSSLRLQLYGGYLQGASVVPEARGNGVYRAMTWRRLEAIADSGRSRAMIWASDETSAPIAQRMGFEVVCRANFHEMPLLETASPPAEAG